ncbi:MAG: hypothetical protein NVS3B1_28240 [Marmoricola sp.]
MSDIVVTWPQVKPLADYLAELDRALREDLLINYRVAFLPSAPLRRCYMVYAGQVRGWCMIVESKLRGEGEVDGWPAGKYIVRSPWWHPVEPVPMRGFQGWRYFNYREALEAHDGR